MAILDYFFEVTKCHVFDTGNRIGGENKVLKTPVLIFSMILFHKNDSDEK